MNTTPNRFLAIMMVGNFILSCLGVFLSSLALLGIGWLFLSQPNETRTKPTTFSVQANEGWQETGLQVQSGQMIQIEYLSGQITDGATTIFDGAGTNYVCGQAGCCEPLPTSARGALIGRVGNEVFLIGNQVAFRSSSGGLLQVRVNDCDVGLYDNAGTFQIQITP